MNNTVTLDNHAAEALVGHIADEFTDRLNRGEDPQIEDYAARHPEIATVLRQVLPALELVRLRSGSGAVRNPGSGETGTLGDFRILGEIGRGGMGIVYEAEQISLGRRVALKVLPFAATMDPRQLQRFHNEARAAACLQHPHIVPVYAVGCERSVHFYAMQLIDGQPLDMLLETLRQSQKPKASEKARKKEHHAERDDYRRHHGPRDGKSSDCELTEIPLLKKSAQPSSLGVRETIREPQAQASTVPALEQGQGYFRRIAELMHQAAEALEHAHQVGIVHRDVKPANLLLDTLGNVWMTDFGLAQIQSDTRLTMTGDLVGTLRYMSPEQALAKRVIVDHRTDIYSLGATFYEILTLVPVFGGQDRQELLRQIAFEEPVAPRRLNRAIPADMETIVLKALEKNPADRYGSAKQVAEDLKRFLHDEPTLARRPSMWQRARKWGRRHVAAVRATAAALVMVVAILAGAVGWSLRERADRELETEQAVVGLLQEADKLQQARKLPEALAKVKQAETIRANGASTPSLEKRVQARLADLKLVADLDDVRLKRAGGGKTAVFDNSYTSQVYARVFREYDIDLEVLAPDEAVKRICERTVPVEIAAALDDWAMLAKGSTTSLNKGFWKQLLAVARATDPDPWRRKLRDALAENDVGALSSLVKAENLPASTAVALAAGLGNSNRHDEAAEVLRAAQQRDPDDFWINYELGINLRDRRQPQFDESIRFLTVAVALRRDSAFAHNILGLSLWNKGRWPEALAEYREAVRLKPDFAMAHNNVGAIYSHCLHDYAGAIVRFQEAIRLKPDFALAHTNLGEVLIFQGQLETAFAEFQEAIRIDPKDAHAFVGLGSVFVEKSQLDEAVSSFRKAILLKPDVAQAHYNLGLALAKKGQLKNAVASYREAIRLKPDYTGAYVNLGALFCDKLHDYDNAITAFGEAIRLEPDFGKVHYNLGLALEKKGQLEDAIASYHEAIRLESGDPVARHGLGNVLVTKGELDAAVVSYRVAISLKPEYVEALNSLGNALMDLDRLDEAIETYREALHYHPNDAMVHVNLGDAFAKNRMLDAAIAAYCAAIIVEKNYARAHWRLGIAHNIKRQWNEAIINFRDAILYKPDFAEAHNSLGVVLDRTGRLDEAIDAYREALRHKPDYPLAHVNLGDTFAKKGMLDTAIASYRDAILVKEDYAQAHWRLGIAHDKKRQWTEAVANFRDAIRHKPDSAEAHNSLGNVLAKTGRLDAAIEAYREALRHKPDSALIYMNIADVQIVKGLAGEAIIAFREAIRCEPSSPLAHNSLAWLLATCADPRFRDAGAAVTSAKKAVDLEPKDGNLWNTLGVARYRKGEWQLAVEALDQSIKLRKGGSASDYFFLAMAQWQLGEKDKAGTWYEKGLDWMNKHAPKDAELFRFRAEAAQLLGIEECSFMPMHDWTLVSAAKR